ncbi:MAG: hypothetical protein JW874_08955 [Spirochaetales bacterium]|nr:hypothetical protein [Spirochaetales bacterium]
MLVPTGKNSIVKRFILFLSIIVFGAGIFITVVDLHLSSGAKNRAMNRQIEQIMESHVDTLVYSLWLFDEKRVQNQVEAIERFPYISRVEVVDSSGQVFSAGGTPSGQTRIVNLDLVYNYREEKRTIGKLNIYLETGRIQRDIIREQYFDLGFHFLFSVIIVIALFVLFRRLVAVPLQKQEDDLRNDSPDKYNQPLMLRRKESPQDELAYLVNAINMMRFAQKKAMDEKNIMIREVHHRIKNNIQTIKSLISLQAQKIPDNEAKSALADADNRLESMFVLYQKLYQSENVSALSAAEYIPDLVAQIVAVQDYNEQIRLSVDIGDFRISADILSSLGIIINELICNSFKHAFGIGRQGQLTVCLQDISTSGAEKPNLAKLFYSDNGKGYNGPGTEADSEGLGFLLIKNLSAQLKGKFEISGKEGFSFTLSFPF